MALSRHVNEEDIIQKSRDHPRLKHLERKKPHVSRGALAARLGSYDVPKFKMPDEGISGASAYQLLHDELDLDGRPCLNLASFVSTWMPDEGTKLVMENLSKNLADQDEYPETVKIQTRCVSMIANLWKVPDGCEALGTATGGSSEAIMLGGLAMKRRWQERRKAEHKDHYHPNVVFGSNAQVAIEKFARYFDVEARLVPVSAETSYVMSPKDAIKYVDENTIGVIVILGSTYTGAFEDVKGMSDLLDEYQARTGQDVPIHVDAASGGFIAPFAYPTYDWSFSVPRVCSINVSGHKYGLTYVGLGWIIWKDKSLLPNDLIFELHYLGSTEYSFNLNFSRPAAPVIAQMFNFLNLGIQGYTRIAAQDLSNARLLSRALENSGYYEVVSEIHRPLAKEGGVKAAVQEALNSASLSVELSNDPLAYVKGLPVVAFKFSQAFKQEYPNVQQAWIQTLLRNKQWIVPNYALPPNAEKVEILRVVVRESMSIDFIERLFGDIIESTEMLMKSGTESSMLAKMSEPEPQKEDLQSEQTQSVFSRTC